MQSRIQSCGIKFWERIKTILARPPMAGRLWGRLIFRKRTLCYVRNLVPTVKRAALTMPKFEFESGFRLRKTLTALGMPDAFLWEVADFSGMTGNRDLFIADVIHKAFVSVDEAGTEAAAATALVVPTAPPPGEEPVEVTVDRPFVFLIHDIQTGAILFVGRVVNPSG